MKIKSTYGLLGVMKEGENIKVIPVISKHRFYLWHEFRQDSQNSAFQF